MRTWRAKVCARILSQFTSAWLAAARRVPILRRSAETMILPDASVLVPAVFTAVEALRIAVVVLPNVVDVDFDQVRIVNAFHARTGHPLGLPVVTPEMGLAASSKTQSLVH